MIHRAIMAFLKAIMEARKSTRKFSQDRQVNIRLMNRLISFSREQAPKAHKIDAIMWHCLSKKEREILSRKLRELFLSNMQKRENAGLGKVKATKRFAENYGFFFEKASLVYLLTFPKSEITEMEQWAQMLNPPGVKIYQEFGRDQLIANASAVESYVELLLTTLGGVSCRIHSLNHLILSLDQKYLPFDKENEVLVGLFVIGYSTESEG